MRLISLLGHMQEYADLGVVLGGAGPFRARIAARLAERLLTSGAFDTGRTADSLERSYQAMWDLRE